MVYVTKIMGVYVTRGICVSRRNSLQIRIQDLTEATQDTQLAFEVICKEIRKDSRVGMREGRRV